MAKNNNLQDFLTDIANIIREKTGTTEPINPQDFRAKIAGIGGGDNHRKLISGTLTELTASDLQGISKIRSYAFYEYHSPISIDIPNSVTSIEGNAFSNCTGLTSVTIGNSVTKIVNYAFIGCTSLTSVKFIGQPPTIQLNTFNNCNSVAKYDFRGATSVPTLSSTASLGHASGCQIIVPDSLYDSWQQATNWAALTDVVWVKASEYTEE